MPAPTGETPCQICGVSMREHALQPSNAQTQPHTFLWPQNAFGSTQPTIRLNPEALLQGARFEAGYDAGYRAGLEAAAKLVCEFGEDRRFDHQCSAIKIHDAIAKLKEST